MEDQATEVIGATQDAFAVLWALAIQYSLSVLGAVILIVLGWLLAGLLERLTRQGMLKISGIDLTLASFFGGVVRYGVLILVIVMVLGQFGVQTASIIAALGAAGLAIGLALQGTLQNIAAGIMLLVLRPFRVGEFIETPEVSGIVQEVGLFATRLKTGDGLYRLAPNSILWNVPITNASREPYRMHDLSIRIGYGDDLDKALNLMLDLAAKDERVEKDPAPSAFVAELQESAILVTLRYWVANGAWWQTTRDMIRAVKRAFDENGISVPYPQVTYNFAESALEETAPQRSERSTKRGISH